MSADLADAPMTGHGRIGRVEEQGAGDQLLAMAVERRGGDLDGVVPLGRGARRLKRVDVEELAALARHRAGGGGKAAVADTRADDLGDGNPAGAGLVGSFVQDDLGNALDVTLVGCCFGRFDSGNLGGGRGGSGLLDRLGRLRR